MKLFFFFSFILRTLLYLLEYFYVWGTETDLDFHPPRWRRCGPERRGGGGTFVGVVETENHLFWGMGKVSIYTSGASSCHFVFLSVRRELAARCGPT